MNNFNYIVLILLNILPWIYFLFIPFRNNTKYGFRKTLLLVGAVIIFFNFMLSLIYTHNMTIIVESFIFQIIDLLISLILAFVLINANKFKIFFVFLVIIPGTLVTVVISNFLGVYFDDYLVATIAIRIVTTFIVSLFFTSFWRKYFLLPTPYVSNKEKELWKYAVLIPSILDCVCMVIYAIELVLDDITILDVVLQFVIFISTILICILLFNCLRYARKEIYSRLEDEKLKYLLDLQKKNLQKNLQNFDRIKRNNHDFRHHLMTINVYATNHENDKLIDYIQNLINTTNVYQQHFFCENMAVNAILVFNYKKAVDNDIQLDFKVSIPEKINISDVDLSILIGNLIENAIEASMFLPKDKRNILVKGKLIYDKLYLIIENNYLKSNINEKKPLLSSKRNYTTEGIGLFTVKSIVHKYSGELDIHYEAEIFTVKVLLSVPEDKL